MDNRLQTNYDSNRQYTARTRVESSNDPQLNRLLFQIYNALIPQVQNIEDAVVGIGEHNKRITELRNHDFIPHALVIIMKVVLYIPIAYLLSPITDGIALAVCHSLQNNGHDILGALFQFTLWIVFLIVDAVIANIVGNLLHSVINKALRPQKQPEINKEEQSIAALKDNIQQTINMIRNEITFVPPAYRNSDALTYFVNAYQNSRVDNLKEAVNAYEAHLEAEKTRSLLHQQIDALTNIQFQNAIMINQLEALRSDVWLSNVIYW